MTWSNLLHKAHNSKTPHFCKHLTRCWQIYLIAEKRPLFCSQVCQGTYNNKVRTNELMTLILLKAATWSKYVTIATTCNLYDLDLEKCCTHVIFTCEHPTSHTGRIGVLSDYWKNLFKLFVKVKVPSVRLHEIALWIKSQCTGSTRSSGADFVAFIEQ